MPFSHFRIGLDYAPPRGWADFDAAGVAGDFAFIAELGIDLVRVPIPWEFLCPTAERVSQVAMGKLLALLDCAAGHGLAVMPALFEGLPSYLGGLSPWCDATALRAQVRQGRQIGEKFRHHPAIAAWDLGSAPDLRWPAPDVDGIWLWAEVVGSVFHRNADKPVLVALAGDASPWSDVREHIDMAGVMPWAGTKMGRWPQDPLVPAFRASIAAQLASRPVVAIGIDPDGPEAPAALYYKEALEALWRAGAVGAFASFSRLRGSGEVRPHAQELAAMARARRPLQPVAASFSLDRDRFRADPTGTLASLFHEFAI